MLSVKTNMRAINANRQLGMTTKASTKSAEKLSSGYRINRAADDAAGLSISEKMRRQVRGLTQAAANAQDGISMVQIGEGALNEVHDMLQRANELAIKAATGTLQVGDRMMIDAEIQQLKAEIDRTANNTTFNEIPIFPENGYLPKEVGYVETKKYDLSFNLQDGSVFVNDLSEGTGTPGTRAVSGGSVLADTIANELVPNAIKQIMDSFPAFKNAMGSDTVKMALEVKYIDGPNQTLAYASYSFYPTGKPASMGIRVDSADFSDADVGGSRIEVLESTLAHELMHSVMQYTLTDGMSGRGENEKFPEWFTEGTAQLAGGGFPTNWNNTLLYLADRLTNENDSSMDSNISNYLKTYTMAGRPYGHGYLGCAYLGYLANGGGDVSAAGIAAGMNKIFEELLNGKTLDQAIQSKAGISVATLNQQFQDGNADLAQFVRKLTYQSLGGAGSVIAKGGLSAGGADLLDNTASDQAFRIDSVDIDYTPSSGSGGGTGGKKGLAMVALQVGAEAGIHIDVDLFQMSVKGLDLEDMNVRTTDDADLAIESIKKAITYVSNVRSHYGAIQNRLEHTIANLNNIIENTAAAESAIRDTDIAEEMVDYSGNQILMQAGTSVLAQANQSSQLILSLLG